jgi:hypothetical protein
MSEYPNKHECGCIEYEPDHEGEVWAFCNRHDPINDGVTA